jgi:hypothetical protein
LRFNGAEWSSNCRNSLTNESDGQILHPSARKLGVDVKLKIVVTTLTRLATTRTGRTITLSSEQTWVPIGVTAEIELIYLE